MIKMRVPTEEIVSKRNPLNLTTRLRFKFRRARRYFETANLDRTMQEAKTPVRNNSEGKSARQ